MWRNFKRSVFFHCKSLEFKYDTWQRGRAIAKAYSEAKDTAGLFSGVLSNARFILLIVAGIAALMLLYIAGGRMAASYISVRRQAPKPFAAAHREETIRASSMRPETAASGTTADTVEFSQALPERMRYCIVANKATKLLYLLSRENGSGPWRIEQQFPAVMGRNEGRKQTAGDCRTPEGTYFIVGRKDKNELLPLYGPLAYVLNYPNEEDRRAGRTGQGIWIHGMPDDSSRMMTSGCIVMQNIRLLSLEKYLKLGIGTPVVIINKTDLALPQEVPEYERIERNRKAVIREYAHREREFRGLLDEWKNAWASRNVDTYSRFYDPQRFFSSGMKWNAWRDRKKGIFQSFDTLEISVDDIRLVDYSESTAVVVFRQVYTVAAQSPRQNAKRLSFFRNKNRWLIYREETFSTEESFL
jgi:murein L,D-transpeptidase YafK